MTTPPFGYFGSKVKIARQIVALMPEHSGYIEPFAGSLSVLLAKPAVGLEVVNDLDGDLMTFWRMLRDQPEELVRICSLTPHSRSEYDASWPIPSDVPDLERARRVRRHRRPAGHARPRTRRAARRARRRACAALARATRPDRWCRARAQPLLAATSTHGLPPGCGQSGSGTRTHATFGSRSSHETLPPVMRSISAALSRGIGRTDLNHWLTIGGVHPSRLAKALCPPISVQACSSEVAAAIASL